MSHLLPPGYHWAPLERRDEIVSGGLQLLTRSIAYPDGITPHICASLDPRTAWSLSGDTDWGRENEDWDLWQIMWSENDELRARIEPGHRIYEIKVYNAIPPDRLWWVGTRQPWLCFE